MPDYVPPRPNPSGPAPNDLDDSFARVVRSSRVVRPGGHAWQPPGADKVARFFPQHEIIEMIGYGGMGAVYKARQITLDRVAAMKLLPLEVSNDISYAARFRREAEAMARLSHPNIVAIYDFGQTAGGYLYIAMEYVDGAMLHDFIHAGNLNLEQNLYIFGQLCEGLAYAHTKGVVHRDVKPGNVLVDRKLRAKLCDFGLARGIDRNASLGGATMTGLVMGTPDYMSPEQKRGGKVDQRADIYSLGVLLYEMLCKETPQGAFEPASKLVGTDPRLDHIITRALQHNPDKRFNSALEMKAALENARQPMANAMHKQAAGAAQAGTYVSPAQARPHPPVRHTPTGPVDDDNGNLLWAGLIGAAVLLGTIGFLYMRSNAKKSASAMQSTPRVAVVATPRIVATPRPATPPPHTPAPTPADEAPEPVIAAKAAPIDLLNRVKLDEDPAVGSWKRTADGLSGEPKDGDKFTVALPYRAPLQFDFLVEFTVPADAQVIQFFPVPGGMAAWKINSQWDDVRFDGLDLLDGKFVNQRGEASRKRTEPLAAGKHTSEVRVRRGHVVALIDGKEVLDWQGPLRRLSLGTSFTFPSHDRIAVGGWGKGIVFTKAEVREVNTKGGVLRTVADAKVEPTPAPATPAPPPATPAPQSEVAKWLAGVDAQFQDQYRREAFAPFEAGVTKLRDQYLASVDSAIASASRANRLEEAVAFRDERARVAGGQQPHEAADDATTPAALKQLRDSWRRAFNKLEAERLARAKPIHARYDAVLEKNQGALTKRQRFDDALLLKAKRDEITSSWLTPPTDFTKPPSAGGNAQAAPLPTGTMKGRDAVEYLLAAGWLIGIDQDGQHGSIASAFTMPSGRFEISDLRINSSRSPDAKQPTDEEMAKLAPMKGLRIFELKAPTVTGSGLGFLSATELEEVSLESPALTDVALTPLLPQRKLLRLGLRGGKDLDLTRLADLTALPALTQLSLSSTGVFIPPATLSRAKALQTLQIERSALTDEHFASIGALPVLENLSFSSCTGVTTAALHQLEKSAHLLRITLLNTPLPPADLAVVAKLRHLETLEIDAEDAAGLAGTTSPLVHVVQFTSSRPGTDASLTAISEAFPKLDTLFVTNASHNFTATGIHALTRLSRLANIHWAQPGLTVPQVAELASLPALDSLTLNATGMTEDHLTALATSRTLGEFIPLGLRLNRACVEALRSMRALRHLDLRSTAGVTPSEIETLRRALPRCRIER